MNQYPSHSQTPDFVKNESHTNPVLFQHPTEEEMRGSRRAQLKADAIDGLLFAVFSFVAWALISFLITAFFGG